MKGRYYPAPRAFHFKTPNPIGRATSADPTTRRVAPPSTLLRTTAASEGKRVTVDVSSTDGGNTAKKMTSTKTAGGEGKKTAKEVKRFVF